MHRVGQSASRINPALAYQREGGAPVKYGFLGGPLDGQWRDFTLSGPKCGHNIGVVPEQVMMADGKYLPDYSFGAPLMAWQPRKRRKVKVKAKGKRA